MTTDITRTQEYTLSEFLGKVNIELNNNGLYDDIIGIVNSFFSPMLDGKVCVDKNINIHNQEVRGIVQINKHTFASFSSYPHIIIWTTNKNEQDYFIDDRNIIKVLKGHTQDIFNLCKLNNNILVSSSWDGTIMLWDINAKSEMFGKCIKKIIGNNEESWVSIDIMSENKLVSCSRNGLINVWDVDVKSSNFGKCIKTYNIEGNYYNITLLGNYIAYSDRNLLLNILDLNQNKTHIILDEDTQVYKGYGCWNTCVEKISEHIIATTDRKSYNIKLWDINVESKSVGKCIKVLKSCSVLDDDLGESDPQGHTDNINCIKKLDRHLLISSSNDFSMCIWDINPDSLTFGKVLRKISYIYNSVGIGRIKYIKVLDKNTIMCSSNNTQINIIKGF